MNASESSAATTASGARLAGSERRRRWTLHGLNNGFIFGATTRLVGLLPKSVSYAIGDGATWLAWRLMRHTREAVADNLKALFPDESNQRLERRARATLRAYARDVIDFLKALPLSPADSEALFEYAPEHARLFEALLAQGKGVILVSGHYGNWEIGSVVMRRVFKLPLTVVAVAEDNDEVNQFRRDVRDQIGVDTIEVRQSLDTALQIRRRLAANGIVALLMDRHMGRDRVAVRFMGRNTWFLRTPALMSAATGAPLVPCFLERTAANRFRVSPGQPVTVATEGPREQALQTATQQIAQQLEARIRVHPEYWYQFYRYWDSQHDGVAPAE